MAKAQKNGKQKRARNIDNPAAFGRAIWNGVCNILRRDKAKGAVQYVPELTWMLFLCALDRREEEERQREEAIGRHFTPSLTAPYRWQDWAIPNSLIRGHYADPDFFDTYFTAAEQDTFDEAERLNTFLAWVNRKLFPALRRLGEQPGASPRQRVISRIFAYRSRTVVESEANLMDALDGVAQLFDIRIDDRHMFPISLAFEGLLPRMGEKKSDGGQFFTPREVIRAMVRVVNPEVGKSVYDPCCGTGGFLIEAFKHMNAPGLTGTQIQQLKSETLWGRETEDLALPICLANMVLHGIDLPRIWHGNTLSGTPTYDGLFQGAPNQFDYILTNPPFGGKEGKTAQGPFPYKSSKTQILFLQHIIESLADGGTCGMVVDDTLLSHTDSSAYVQTKRKLFSECDVWCIVSLPANVFANAGASGKTALLFFTKGKSTTQIWYYDLSAHHVTKKNPLTLEDFEDVFQRVAAEADSPDRVSEASWWLDIVTRREELREEAEPFKRAAEEARAELASQKQQLRQLQVQLRLAQKTGTTTPTQAEIQTLESLISETAKHASGHEAQAKEIEESLYDLKAQNPNAPDRRDKRSVAQLLEIVRDSNATISASLAQLLGSSSSRHSASGSAPSVRRPASQSDSDVALQPSFFEPGRIEPSQPATDGTRRRVDDTVAEKRDATE